MSDKWILELSCKFLDKNSLTLCGRVHFDIRYVFCFISYIFFHISSFCKKLKRTGDFGMISPQSLTSFLICWLNFFVFLIGWFIKLSVGTFQPLIEIYGRGNFVYINLTTIVLPLLISRETTLSTEATLWIFLWVCPNLISDQSWRKIEAFYLSSIGAV